MREVGEGRGGPEDLEKTRTPQSTPKPNLQSAVRQGERETLPPDRIRRKKEIFWPEGSLEGGLRPSEGTVGGDVLGPPWVLQAIFDVAAPVSQDNDEAGTIYLVRSPPDSPSFLASLRPAASLGLNRWVQFWCSWVWTKRTQLQGIFRF